jgi:hypothetical protein
MTTVITFSSLKKVIKQEMPTISVSVHGGEQNNYFFISSKSVSNKHVHQKSCHMKYAQKLRTDICDKLLLEHIRRPLALVTRLDDPEESRCHHRSPTTKKLKSFEIYYV